jgi:hypothetical protein
MSRIKTAHHYRRLAIDCRRSAEAAQTRDRQLWLRLARHWEAMAQAREPNVYPFTIYQRARPAKQVGQHDQPSVLPGPGLLARSAASMSSGVGVGTLKR